jgi:hypothetical protein
MDITTVGLDLAKHIFQVYGVAAVSYVGRSKRAVVGLRIPRWR